MQVDGELIAYLEALSCLKLSDHEKPHLTGDLENILTYMSHLSEIDTENVPECSHPFDKVNVFREDTVNSSLEGALLLQNAPEVINGMFAAPMTVE